MGSVDQPCARICQSIRIVSRACHGPRVRLFFQRRHKLANTYLPLWSDIFPRGRCRSIVELQAWNSPTQRRSGSLGGTKRATRRSESLTSSSLPPDFSLNLIYLRFPDSKHFL